MVTISYPFFSLFLCNLARQIQFSGLFTSITDFNVLFNPIANWKPFSSIVANKPNTIQTWSHKGSKQFQNIFQKNPFIMRFSAQIGRSEGFTQNEQRSRMKNSKSWSMKATKKQRNATSIIWRNISGRPCVYNFQEPKIWWWSNERWL